MKKKSKIRIPPKKEVFEDWFQRIYEANFECLFRYAYSVTKDKQLAEDVVSEVFFNILNNKPDHENIRELGAYLRVSVKHLAIRVLSKDLQRFPLSNYDDALEISHTINPEHLLLGKELEAIITEVIDSLSPQIHLVFNMSRNKGYSHQEMSGSGSMSIMIPFYRLVADVQDPLPTTMFLGMVSDIYVIVTSGLRVFKNKFL